MGSYTVQISVPSFSRVTLTGKMGVCVLIANRAVIGENAAVRMLRDKGYEILVRDCRFRSGEIDIVARSGMTLIFAEVKTRRLRKNTSPAPGTNLRTAQKRRIYRAALTYMKKIGKPRIPYRFDLIEVLFSRFGLAMMYHHPGAFGAKTFEKMKQPAQAVNYFD